MKVCIFGSGTMGRGLIQLFAQASFVQKVYVVTRSPAAYKTAVNFVGAKLNGLLEKGYVSNDDLLLYLEKIECVDKFEEIYDVDFLIEAVAEEINIKKDLFKKLSKFISSKTIVASNTSSLSITEIASVLKYKENFIGLHFFNPAPIMSLTEVVTGMLTSEDTKKYAYDLSLKLGKTPVYVNEAPGFVVNRMLIPMINEAIGVFSEGVANASDIDTALIKGANHPIGPLSLADMIGNDVCLSIMDVLHSETGDPKYRAHPLLRKMVRAGKLGRKSGSGFFEYG